MSHSAASIPFIALFNRDKFKSYGGKIILSFTFALLSCTSFAQSYESEVDILQELFGQEKKVAVANFMDLGEESEGFWNLYEEYEQQRKKLGIERIKIILDYASSYQNISDEEILALFKRRKAFRKSFGKLQDKYFNRMKKEVGVSKAAQFWQFESYINSIIQAEIYSQIPFIGENLKEN